MAKKSLQEVIKQNQQLGFEPAIIEIAYANVKGDSSRIIDEIFRLQTQSSAYPVKPSNPQDEEAQLSKAIQMSITEAKDNKISLQPLNPQQRVRKSGMPVGLKNIGNTCYFNSLLQTYFQNVNFVREILKYEIPSKYCSLPKQQVQKLSQQNFEFKRKYASCKLVENLKILFAQMIASDRKYVDPTSVLTSVVDDYGNELPIGDQKDIGEFNLIFLSRIDQGLGEATSQNRMQIQDESEKAYDSPSKLKVVGGGDNQNQPQSQTHSLLKHSSIKLSQKSIITEQFIGKISTSFHNQQMNINKHQQQLFSLLFVNVKNKELYQALEEVVISHIDDYRNQKGEVVGVEKRTWIEEAPKTLFFQIDRVSFDKQKGTLQKINDIFDFPKEFYIDPFLDKNKQTALQIQFKVRQLRAQKIKYIEYLGKLQNYGQEKQSLLKTFTMTSQFLQSQLNKMQLQATEIAQQQPLMFPKLQHRITPQAITMLKAYAQELQKKESFYRQRIGKIQEQIQKCYESIRTQPYILQSILIHEGSAQMGHYYSYIYDIESCTWRKYNDINITEQSEAQVLKQAKGVNTTSAYYLVYVLKQVLLPHHSHSPAKSYSLSSDDSYLKDYYSSFLSPPLKSIIQEENHHMYYEIEQYKMGSLAARVIDAYTKKFEICNQTFRKSKPDKKKNTTPLLINYPLYLKLNDESWYKQALIEHCIQEYGPKEYSPAFDQLLTKKLANFNQHKRPKKLHLDNKSFTISTFLQQVYRAIATKMIFHALKEESYSRIFGLMRQLQTEQNGNYFNWLGALLSKTIVVHLLIEAEKEMALSPEEMMKKLNLMTFLLFKFIHLEQEKILHSNCVFWLTEIGIAVISPEIKQQCQRITQMISEKKYNGELDQLFVTQQTQNLLHDIKSTVDLADAAWNLSRTQDVYIQDMLGAREQVKEKIQAANQLYREMKKFNIPLEKAVRDKIVYKRKQ